MAKINKKEAEYLFAEKKPFSVMERTLTQYQPFHWHDFYEIEYIVDGEGEYIINGISHRIKPQMLFFSTPSDFHEITFNSETKIIKIQFLPEFINPEFQKLLTEPIVLDDTENVYPSYLTLICRHGVKNDHYSSLFVKHMVNAMLFLIASARNTLKGEKLYTINSHFHRILMYINNHFTEEISLQELSKKVSLSPDYLSTLFKKHSGQKISDYITTLRLNHAYNLIKNTDIPINEVYYLCGYNSYPHFIRAFKTKYGDSPNLLRKKLCHDSEEFNTN